ncbi:MAG: hypothetical protein JWM27_3108 [Gemmatimonadetes bacterium]|nr:hypothetical protein [Gemmatimonadota bacterium]
MTRISFALLAGALLTASPALGQAQLSDRSGAITFSISVAPFVEVVSHETSLHDMTFYFRDGVPPGYGAIGTFNLLSSNPPIREVRANVPYRLSIVGLRADGKLVFRNAAGDEQALTTACDNLASPDPSTRTLATIFNCQGSGTFAAPNGSRWLLFHAYTPRKEDLNNARAGVYTATIYMQIDAA